MNKKQTKIIASILVFIMMWTYLSIIGEVLAVSLETQSTKTNHTNVEFDSYFKKEDKKTHSTTQTIGEENYLYASVNVKEAGYLKDAYITVENANFTMNEMAQTEKAYQVEENKIALNRITNGTTEEIAIPIQMLEDSKIAVEEWQKENTVKLTGTYVDGNGKEKSIEKEIKLALAWTAEKEAELNMQIAKFIPYNVNEQKGVILQTIVKSYLKDNTVPVKENRIEISVPTIDKIKPEEVKVTANSTKATNGDETGSNFADENYEYSKETNKLTILVKNEVDEQGKVAWQRNAEDEFVITYIYSEEALNHWTEEGILISINASADLTVYGASETKVSKEFNGEVTLKDSISYLVDFSIKTNVEQISKGQIYANKQASQKVETEYQETLTATIGLAELTDKMILERQADYFLMGENAKTETQNANYYKTLEIDEKAFQKILGEEGNINLYVGTTLVSTINQETKSNEQGKIEVDLSSLNTNNITIETSKPQEEGKLDFVLTKAIKGDISNTNAQMQSVKGLELNLVGKAVNGEENFVEQEAKREIALTEPTSQAELTMSNSNLSTVVTNKDVKITAILKTDTLDCKLYQNPTLQITLPKEVENIQVKNVEAFFDTETSKLTVKSYEVVTNADGSKTIYVILEGTQTEYTLGAVAKGVNVVVTADITLNQFTPNKQDKITMVYTNSNVITVARAAMQEVGEVSTGLNIVAPTGVVTTNTMSNYAEGAEVVTSISGEEKTATIPILSGARNTNFSMKVMNNYNNTIDHISILGRTLFVGNKDAVSSADLGSTMNMPLVSNIEVAGVDASKVTIYYSENANATKDVNLTSNGWTTTPSNLANVKSYLIVLSNTTMNTGDNITFNYTAQIPANLQHNQSAYENYVVYFNNNLEKGMIEDKQVASKVGVTTGRGPVIETSMVSDKTETEEVLTGNIIKYTLTVKNTGTETANNVTASINLPTELNYVEKQQDSNSYKTICLGGQTANIEIGNLEPNKTLTKEILMKVGTIIATAEKDTAVAEIKATVTANNVEGSLETNTLKNTLAKTYYSVGVNTVTNNTVLREGDTYYYYIEVLSSDTYETQEETVLTITLPKEIEYQSVEVADKINNKETDITNTTTSNYDKDTRKLTLELGEVKQLDSKIIRLHVKVNSLPENTYSMQTNIDAKISGKGARTQDINVQVIKIGKVGFKIAQSSNIPENAHISAYEDYKYVFTIENLSNLYLTNVKITDVLPTEIALKNIIVTRQSGEKQNIDKKELKISFNANETITMEVYVTAIPMEETTKITNKATIEYEGIDTIESSDITHYIDKYDYSNIDNPNYDPNNPSNQTKRIMGTIWVDENENGMRDENEEKVPNVEMLLFNNETGKLVTDATGNILKVATDENGTYAFVGISKGKYTVIYLYDTANYSATTYRKEGVDETLNSDAVDSKITLDGVSRVAAITEEVAVTDSNIYNIDLGLVSNPKFDLKLDKTVSKITVQDGTGTNVYEYQDSKLAKKDLVGKQIAGTTIIVEYKIKVTNEGAISGFAKKIADYMPEEMKFNSELNKDWYSSENGTLYNASLANTLINPGESKEVTLILTKKMTESNLGLYHNEAEIYESYNDLGIQDIDSVAGNKVSSEDDISSADVLITVKTGEAILFVGLSLTIIAIIGIGAYFIKKKVLR